MKINKEHKSHAKHMEFLDETALSVRRRGRSAAEEFSAVGQFDGTAIPDRSSGFSAKPCNFDLRARLNRVCPPTESDKSVWRAKFETPVAYRAIQLFNIDV